MILDINMLGASVITSILSQRDGQLTVRVQRSRMSERAENFLDESAEPNPFFGSVCGSNVFGLCGGKGNKLLLL